MSSLRSQIIVLVIAVAILVLGVWYIQSMGDGDGGENESKLNITLVGSGGEKVVVDYDQLTGMGPVSGRVSYQNRLGNWGEQTALEGVLISDLVEMVGGMEPGDELRIMSGDGYYQDFAYYNVYPDDEWELLQGDFILAFTADDDTIPGWVDGPMTAFLPPDEMYSNDDCKYTSGPGQGFFASPSGGARFVKGAWHLEVRSIAGTPEWSLDMDGEQNSSLSRTEFGSLAMEFRSNVTDQGGSAWSGIPVWRILGLIDGGPARGEGSYNTSYALEGYEVRLVGSISHSYASEEIHENDGIIIADIQDGSAVPSPVLVSQETKVEGITKIGTYPLWKTSVSGENTLQLFYSEILELGSVEGTAGYLKVTGAVIGPFEIKGVPLLSILQLSGGLPSEYSVEVTAADGYSIMLSKEEVEGEIDIFDESGQKVGFGGATCVLYYEVDGSLDFSGKPFRIGFLKGEGDVTDSHYWVKEVSSLTIRQPVRDWSLELNGLSHYTLNRTSFEAAATCIEHRSVLNITSKGETHGYQGLPIWVLLSIVDGLDDPEGHYFFNDDLARDGYNVTIVAADGFSTTLNSSVIWRNDEIILAYLVDGEVLPEEDGPLMVVGEDLGGKQRVKQVASVNLILPLKWTVNLSGLTQFTLNSTAFESAVACHDHGTEINLTRKGETHIYNGLPLWVVVGMVDGGDSPDHPMFNYELAQEGYDIVIFASDGFNATLNSTLVTDNDQVLLANLEDGIPLPEDDGPVKLVGIGLSGKQMLKQVVKIEILLRD